MIFWIINKPEIVFVSFHNKFLVGLSVIIPCFFFGILVSKQITPASLLFFQFRKIITDGSIIFFTEVKCKENTQITNMEETEKHHWVIRLMYDLEMVKLFDSNTHSKFTGFGFFFVPLDFLSKVADIFMMSEKQI